MIRLRKKKREGEVCDGLQLPQMWLGEGSVRGSLGSDPWN